MTRQANALLVIMVSFLLAFWLRFGSEPLPQEYLTALLTTLLVSALVLPATGCFRAEFDWAILRKLVRLTTGWAVVVLMLVSIAAMLKSTDSYSRIWFGMWVMMCTAGLVTMMLISHAAGLRRRRRNLQARRIVLVGAGDAAARVEARLRGDPAASMSLVACFGSPWSDTPVMPLESLADYIREHRIHEVWIAAPWDDKSMLKDALDAVRESVVDVNVIPDLYQYRLLNQNISEWGGLPVITLSGTPLTASEIRLKSLLDWVLALVITILLSPLLLVIAVLVKLSSPGPIFFKQERHGLGGELIEILKFRSMSEHEEEQGVVTQATPDDQRVTWVGRFLRHTSLDELPQLLNVLKGEMSLVGPRPHAAEHNDLFKSRIPRYMLRHKVKPGLTGWAQVNGFRGQTESEEKMELRIEHDLWYIQNWSLWLDLKILLLTPLVMVHPNAY